MVSVSGVQAPASYLVRARAPARNIASPFPSMPENRSKSYGFFGWFCWLNAAGSNGSLGTGATGFFGDSLGGAGIAGGTPAFAGATAVLTFASLANPLGAFGMSGTASAITEGGNCAGGVDNGLPV